MKNFGSTLDKLQPKLFQLFPIQKSVLYNILRVPWGESIEIEPNVTELLPYMAITHNNEGCGLIITHSNANTL